MGKESKQIGNLSGALTCVEEVKVGEAIGYDLYLDNGTRISLPPEGKITRKSLQIGDRFELEPRVDVFEGKPKKYDNQTRITVTRINKPSANFITTNDSIRLSDKIKK
jgi:hypothetical protein